MLSHRFQDFIERIRHRWLEVAGVDLARQVVGLQLLVRGVLDSLLQQEQTAKAIGWEGSGSGVK